MNVLAVQILREVLDGPVQLRAHLLESDSLLRPGRQADAVLVLPDVLDHLSRRHHSLPPRAQRPPWPCIPTRARTLIQTRIALTTSPCTFVSRRLIPLW